jgi:hypothetical protein
MRVKVRVRVRVRVLSGACDLFESEWRCSRDAHKLRTASRTM